MNVTAYMLASRYLGQKEREGAADNPHIRAWLFDVGFGPDAHDEIPWCASFVRHVAYLLDLPIPHLPARARSWLTVGEPVELFEALQANDVVVLRRGGGHQPGPEVLDAPGHVGFFSARQAVAAPGLDSHVIVLGGNQGDAVSIAHFNAADVLGVRRLTIGGRS